MEEACIAPAAPEEGILAAAIHMARRANGHCCALPPYGYTPPKYPRLSGADVVGKK